MGNKIEWKIKNISGGGNPVGDVFYTNACYKAGYRKIPIPFANTRHKNEHSTVETNMYR